MKKPPTLVPRRPVIVEESPSGVVYHYHEQTSLIGVVEARAAILDRLPGYGVNYLKSSLDHLFSSKGKPLSAPDVLSALEGLVGEGRIWVDGLFLVRLKA
jgi:hypothetical protein